MSTSDSLRIGALPVQSLAFGSILGTYVPIGIPSLSSSRLLLLQNLTDQLLMFSLDGISDHIPMNMMSSMIFDITTNRTANASGFYLAANTRIYVRSTGVAPTLGSAYVTFFIGVNNND